MSKNFEEAYKEELQQNIPDLWNRIEAGLTPKTVYIETAAVEINHNGTEVIATEINGNTTNRSENKTVNDGLQTDRRKPEQNNQKHKKKKSSYAWMKWATIAAAAMIVLLILPGIAGIGTLGLILWSGGLKNESLSYDQSFAEQAADSEWVEDEACDGGFNLEDSIVTEDAMEEEIWMEDEFESAQENAETQVGAENETGSQPEETGKYPALAENIPVTVSEVIEYDDVCIVKMQVEEADRLELADLPEDVFCDEDILIAVADAALGERPIVGQAFYATVYDNGVRENLFSDYRVVLTQR